MTDNTAHYLASEGLQIGAIKLNPTEPFQWASGYRMPIYNDNRMFLENSGSRNAIAWGFINLIQKKYNLNLDFIAGTSTAGIPPATTLADKLCLPLIYIRDKPKGHGLKNQIEGIDATKDLEGKTGVVIEDLISTGGSSARAVQAVRDANGIANYCFSIFSYGLDKADKSFSELNPSCIYDSLLTYDILMEEAKKLGKFTDNQINLLEDWKADPFGWGEKNGFPKVKK